MIRILFFLFFFLNLTLLNCVYASDTLKIEVRQAGNNRIVENAFLYAQNGKVQAFSNESGVAKLLNIQPTDTIFFSHPSFYSESISQEELTKTGNILYVLERNIFLDEFIVTAGKKDEPRDLISNVTRIQYNQSFSLQGHNLSTEIVKQSGQHRILYNSPGEIELNIRGFSDHRLLTLVDGTRTAQPGRPHQAYKLINPLLVDRIETVFGPGSLIYGSDAIGGVVNVITKKPRILLNDKPEFSGEAMISGNTANLESNISALLNSSFKNTGLITAFSFQNSEQHQSGSRQNPFYSDFGKNNQYIFRQDDRDYIVNNPSPFTYPNSSFQQWNFAQKLRTQISVNRLLEAYFYIAGEEEHNALGRLQERSESPFNQDGVLEVFEDTGFVSYPDTNVQNLYFAEFYHKPTVQWIAGIKYADSEPFLPGDNMNVHISFRKSENNQFFRLLNSPDIHGFESQFMALQANLDMATSLTESSDFSYGLEADINFTESETISESIDNTDIDELNFSFYPDGKNLKYSLSAYIRYDVDLSSTLRLTQGFRYSFINFESLYDEYSMPVYNNKEIAYRRSAFSGSFGISYRPSSNWNFNFTASSGYRSPNIDDIAKTHSPAAGILMIPNPILKPEYAYNVETRVLFKLSDQLRAEAFVYNTILKNAIVVQNVSPNNTDSLPYLDKSHKLVSNVNIGTAYVRGGGYSVEAALTRDLFVESYGNFAVGFDSDFNERLPGIPPFYGLTRVNYRYEKFNFSIRWNVQAWKPSNEFSPYFQDNLTYATAEGSPAYHVFDFDVHRQINDKLRVYAGLHNIADAHYRPYGSSISGIGRNLRLGLYLNY
ncbi:MAG: hypothetical protein EA412_05750 [Chitinophagaceae bacterium]|nr:MAG: hypothetical protein EA412_05750 [Chitinophagaceae bacterium]